MLIFEQDGIELVPGAFASSSIHSLSSMTNDVLNSTKNIENSVTVQSVAKRKPNSVANVIPASAVDVPFIISDLVSINPKFERYFLGDNILEVVGIKLGVSSDRVQLHFSNITSKPPRIGPSVSIHRDYPNQYYCPVKSNFIRLLIPLDSMSEINGGLFYLPNSHHITDSLAKSKDLNIKYSQTKTICAEPGDAVLLHSKLLHGSPCNASDEYRRLIVLQYGIFGEEIAVSPN